MSGLELAQKATEELASPGSTHENNPLSVRKRKARLKFGLARVKDVKLKTRDVKLGL